MKILILDDDPERHLLFGKNFSSHTLHSVYTVDQAIESLEKEKYDAVFLDHDLGGKQMVESDGDEPTGYHVAKWLADNPEHKPEQIYIHSYNPDGARRMSNILPGSFRIPGLWMIKQPN